MKPSKLNIENLWQEIHSEISRLDVAEDFRHNLLEDVELAVVCFKEKNTLSVLNCLSVLAGKVQSHVILSRCHYSVVEKLLTGIHHLQQILIRLPVCIIGPIGPTEPTGATGPAGTPGLKGPTGGIGMTGPNGLAETTIVTTSSYPVSSLSIPEAVPVKSGYFDYRTHIVIYRNSRKKR